MCKKLISLLTVLLLLMSCAMADAPRVGVMSGPTGMGLAQMMTADTEGAWQWEIYSSPTGATADLASGALDFLCLPTNTAAALCLKQPELLCVIAVDCLGSLYLISDGTIPVTSVQDLAGQALYASVPSSTTKPILETILGMNGVEATIEWEADHDALAARVIRGDVHLAVLPEPKASAAMAKTQGWQVVLSLSDCWAQVLDTPLTMGCVVVRNELLQQSPETVEAFLQGCGDSIAFIGDPANRQESAAMIAAAGILPSEGIASKALGNLYGAIVCLTGSEMKAALQGFYTAIGQPQPGDSFYYGAAD